MIAFSPEQIFLVTGASSGIGSASALLLNRLGATVIAAGRDMQRLAAVKDLAQIPAQFFCVARDFVLEMDSLPLWVAGLAAAHGKFTGLLHCAGQTWNAPMQAYDLTASRQVFDLLCHAPLLLAKGFTDRRNNIGKGAGMVFIAAAAAVKPNPGQGMYGAAKAALVTASHCLAKELAPRGIRANCISPGLVEGPMMEATVNLLGSDFIKRELPAYPLGFGAPQDVANLAVFMLSDQARWLTGENIMLTGGR